MTITKKTLTLMAMSAAVAASAHGNAFAQMTDNIVRVGFITDLSGLYSDIDGPGGLEAAKMAVADFGGTVNGKKIEVVAADHQNKPDIAAAKAREWLDNGVDMIVGGVHSSAMLAINRIAADKKKPFFVMAAVTTRLTNEECTPYTIHYSNDSVALARVAGTALAKQGDKSWYFLTVDNAGGIAMENDATAAIEKLGGKRVGAARHPLNAADFSTFITQAMAAKPQVLALANSGGDMVNAVKAASEFGVLKHVKLTSVLTYLTDIHGLGLGVAQGMYVTDGWYWDQNPETREWSKRFFAKMKRPPTFVQAGEYSAVLSYLKAVKAAGSDDGDQVMAKLKSLPINDMFMKKGYIRQDGRLIHDMYLMQVKKPAESTYPWDYLKLIQTVPGEQVFTTKQESRCALWK